jgi:hypothetical protein
VPTDRRRPTPPETPPVPPRVVVKLREEGGAPPLAALRGAAPWAEFRPYFTEPELRLASRPPFDRYVTFTAPNRREAAEMARRLAALPMVEEAYVEDGPVPPPAPTPDNDPES